MVQTQTGRMYEKPSLHRAVKNKIEVDFLGGGAFVNFFFNFQLKNSLHFISCIILVKHLFSYSHWSIWWTFIKHRSGGNNAMNSLVSTIQCLSLSTHGQSCFVFWGQFLTALFWSPHKRGNVRSRTLRSHIAQALLCTQRWVYCLCHIQNQRGRDFFFLSPFLFSTKDMCCLSSAHSCSPCVQLV